MSRLANPSPLASRSSKATAREIRPSQENRLDFPARGQIQKIGARGINPFSAHIFPNFGPLPSAPGRQMSRLFFGGLFVCSFELKISIQGRATSFRMSFSWSSSSDNSCIRAVCSWSLHAQRLRSISMCLRAHLSCLRAASKYTALCDLSR